MDHIYDMLLRTYVKQVMKRRNKYTEPQLRLKRVGVFSCDECQIEFEIEDNLLTKEKRNHHFCSKQCQGQARKPGGCLNYVYDTFVNPFSKQEVKEKIRQTMLTRYGSTSTMGSQSLREKVQNTMIERYGGPTPFSAPVLRDKLNFSQMAHKRHLTMKSTNAYASSKEENAFGQYLTKFGIVERNVLINKHWPIDFYLRDHDVYVQYDGVYWHGLDRPLAEIAQHKTKRDITIHQKWLTDREQEKWFAEHKLKLIRVPSTWFDAKTLTCPSFEHTFSNA